MKAYFIASIAFFSLLATTTCVADRVRAARETFQTNPVGNNNADFSRLIQLLSCPLQCDCQVSCTAINDVLNTLTECCATLTADFQATWTILNEIINSSTACCIGTFTLIEDVQNTLTTCCADLQATITADFQATWTILNDIFTSSTTCCASTFTVLEDIRNTITECCNGTFTVLANLTITATTDLSGVFTVLADITTTITECCNDTFTTLANLCRVTPIFTSTIIDESGSYCLSSTGITSIVITTSNVTLDMNGYTIADGTVGITIEDNLQDILIYNGQFHNMSLPAITIGQGCKNIILKDLIISSCALGSGFPFNFGILSFGDQFNRVTGCIFENIYIHGCPSGFSVINTDASVFQDCTVTSCTISPDLFVGYFIVGQANKLIYCQATDCMAPVGDAWGVLTSRAQGLVLDSFFTCTLTALGSVTGISIDDGTNGTYLNDCEVAHLDSMGGFDGASAIGIRFNSTNCRALNCNIFNIGTSFVSTASSGGVHGTGARTTILDNVVVSRIGASNFLSFGFDISNSSDESLLHDCVAVDITGSANAVGFRTTSTNVNFEHCQALNVEALTSAIGFDLGVTITLANNYTVQDCVASNIFTTDPNGLACGYRLQSYQIIMDACIAQDVLALGVTSTAYGIASLSETGSLVIDNCTISGIVGTDDGIGIAVDGADAYVRNSLSTICSSTALNISSSASDAIVENCSTTRAGTGLNNGGTNSIIFNCFAADNIANYVAVPNLVTLGSPTIVGGNIDA